MIFLLRKAYGRNFEWRGFVWNCSRILLSFCADKREVFMGIVAARWREDECMRVRFSPCDN